MKKFDALIIGSGISSLTCALLLAKAEKSVCVLEQHTKPGGFMHCFNRFGHQFDTGAHYVGGMNKGQPFRVLLEYLGLYDEEDRARGYLLHTDRKGQQVKVPLLSISIALVTSDSQPLTHPGQVAKIGAELKAYAKQFDRSLYVKERRQAL